MNAVMIFVLILGIGMGVAAGAGIMFWIQRKMRMRELERIIHLTENIKNGKRIRASGPGEELLLSRIELDLVRVQEILEGRKSEAEKSRDEIQKLISEIAHQMRTPLTNIETYTEIIREEAGNDGQMAVYLSALEESERKVDVHIESFVQMYMLEKHVMQVRKEKADLVKTVRDALGQVQSRAERKNICFDIHFPEQAVCSHDANWLGEAVYNMLDNGVKYSSPGGRIDVSVSVNDMFYKIRVRDYGIGIDAGEESMIFRRFYRGRRVTGQEGFGIGLYLAREIVNLHGGFMLARRMEQGLLMEIDLPV